MSNLLDRMLNIVGWDEDQKEVVEQEEVIERDSRTVSKKSNPRKIVNIHEPINYNVSTLNVMQPESFEDARDICECLKAKQPVIINLENISRDLAQRIVDFVSGAIYSLEGDIKKISAGIFIVTPNTFRVEENHNESLQNEQIGEKNVFPWMS
ncbi:MAG: cell division protein SepF [Clostridia bacterium]|nr:cell division protein SepF [Clostridia bacterium]